MFSCLQQLFIYVLSKLLSQAVCRWLGRQRLYHIWAPCAHFRTSNSLISLAPPQNRKTFVSHWLAKVWSLFEPKLWPLSCIGQHKRHFSWNWAGNVHSDMGWRPRPLPLPLHMLLPLPFPREALKGLYKSQFLVKDQMSVWALDHPIFVLCLFTRTFKTKHVAEVPTSSWERSRCYITL